MRLAVSPEDALALAEQWVAAVRARGQLLDPRPLPVCRHAEVDDLDRVAEGVSVLLLVEAVELLERLGREALLRQRDPQLVALSDVAAVEAGGDLDLVVGDAVVVQPRAQLGGGGGQFAVEPRARRSRPRS